MSNDLEANLEIAESPLLSGNARKRWRVAKAAIVAFTLPREIAVENLGLELTSVASMKPMYKLRVALMALRSIVAFSRAGDYHHAIPESQDEMRDVLLESSPSHGNLDEFSPRADWLCDLVGFQSIEQLRQCGGVETVALALGTHTEHGILGDDESIARRRQNFGSNRIEKPPPQTLEIVLETIEDPLIIILLLSAALSLGFGIRKYGLKGWSDGGSIFAAVFLVIAVTACCKIWSRRQIFKLSIASDDFPIDIIRNGQLRHISVFDAVVGDVICLKLGDQVPADGLYIHGNSLQVDESNMTEAMGSSKLKDGNDPFLLSGSKVTNGSGRMLVTAVGMNAARGQILSTICSDANEKTPLEMKLHKLTMLIAKVGLVTASVVLVVLLISYFAGHMHDRRGRPEFVAGKTRIAQVCSAMIGISATPFAIASTAIPDGLLLAATITIAYSAYRMAAAGKALVKNPFALEEIGSTTVICTNERGNLTTHKLEVSRFWFGKDTFSLIAPNVVSDNTQVLSGTNVEATIRDWAFQQKSADTEQMMRANHPIPHQKGDPEDMLAKCSQYYDENGQIKDINDDVREILKQKIVEMKSKCLQCIAFSCSDACEDNGANFHPKFEGRFILIGFAGLTYRCPPEIKEAVLDFQRAGVNIKLVTRTELPAARAIAFECGILNPNQDTTIGEVVEGHDFENFSEEERLEKSDKIRVMARASTLQRRLMVKTLKQKGHVVAVTGDSVGDADVLKEADVGLSLGIQGTNIAKENSDIIILNDNFDSISTALKWGRGMYYRC